MSLYKMLSKAQTKSRGGKDGDYFNAHQQGVMVITKLEYFKIKAKEMVILAGVVFESNAKQADAKLQPPGTKVKRIYPLSKRDWAIDDLRTDLLSIAGTDEDSMSPAQLEEMFADAFEGSVPEGSKERPGVGDLIGVACTFNTVLKEREGKHGITNVYFDVVEPENEDGSGGLNDNELVSARKKKILAGEAIHENHKV